MKKKEYKKKLEKEKREMREFRESDTGASLKTGLIIAASVIGFVLLMFAFTKIKTGEWEIFTKENDVNYVANAQTTKILCGSILNRSDEEYLVIAYKMKEDSGSLYDSILERYNSGKSLPLYKVDLSNSRNNICVAENVNISNNISELKIKEPTLLKIKNGSIIESYTEYETIKTNLLSYVD